MTVLEKRWSFIWRLGDRGVFIFYTKGVYCNMTFPTHIVAVGAFVKNDKDEILLVKHPHKGWEFPGGIVEIGESLPQALKREVQEESGIFVKVNNIVGLYSNTEKREGYNGVKEIPTIVNVDFVCSFLSGELTTSAESIESGWFSKEKSLELVTNECILYRLNNMIEYNGSFHCDAFKIPFAFSEQYLFEK